MRAQSLFMMCQCLLISNEANCQLQTPPVLI